MMKKILSMLLAALMLCTIVPFGAFASYDALKADTLALTNESLLTAALTKDGYLLDALRLPSQGSGGSAITWQSSDSSVIDPTNGNVIRPVSADANVTLTAKIQNGSEYVTKTFDYKVASLASQPAGTPKLAGAIITDEFNDGIVDTSYIKAQNSARVSESDGSLTIVSNDGDKQCLTMHTGSYAAYQGNGVYTEYVFKYRSDSTIRFRGYDAAASTSYGWIMAYSFDIQSTSNKKIDFVSYDSAQSGNVTTTYDLPNSATRFKIAIYNDVKNKTYSVWIDNALLFSGKYIAGMKSDKTYTGVGEVNIQVAGTSHYFSLESFRQYAVASDTSLLTLPAKLGDNILYQSFDTDGTYSNVSKAMASDGQLQVNTGDYVHITNGDINYDAGYAATTDKFLDGLIGVEFTASRSNDYHAAQIRFWQSGWTNDHARIHWVYSGNASTCDYRKNPSDTPTSCDLGKLGNKLNVKFVLDTGHKTFSLWINDALLIKNGYSAIKTFNEHGGFGGVMFSTESGTARDITIDNYRVYNVLPAEADRYYHDKQNLNDSLIADTLTNADALPESLPLGAKIAWSSDNLDVISNTGVITQQSTAQQVTLTATISGEIDGTADTATKTYTVTVPAYTAPTYSITDSESGYIAEFYASKDGRANAATTAYLALYDGGELVGIKLVEIPAAANDGTSPVAVFEYAAEEIETLTNASVKAFVWTDFGITPLAVSNVD